MSKLQEIRNKSWGEMVIFVSYIKMHIISASLATCTEPWAAGWAVQTVSVFVRKHKIHQQLPTQRETRTAMKLIWLKPKIKCLNSCVLGQLPIIFHTRPKRKKVAFNSQIDFVSVLPVMRCASVNNDWQRSGCRATQLSVRRELWNQCRPSSGHTHWSDTHRKS